MRSPKPPTRAELLEAATQIVACQIRGVASEEVARRIAEEHIRMRALTNQQTGRAEP